MIRFEKRCLVAKGVLLAASIMTIFATNVSYADHGGGGRPGDGAASPTNHAVHGPGLRAEAFYFQNESILPEQKLL